MTARRNSIAYLALLALSLQILAGFGHSHPLKSQPLRFAATSVIGVADLKCRTFLPSRTSLPCPPPRHNEAECAVCATLAQARNAILPVASSVPTPWGAVVRLHGVRLSNANPASRFFAFEARGPPRQV